MSQYKEYFKTNIFLVLPILLGAIFYLMHPHHTLLLIFAGAFTYSTLFMSPNLDSVLNIRPFSLYGIFSLPFRSYAKLFSRRLSHHVILGSVTRILWLIGWGCLVFFIIYKSLPTKSDLLQFYKHYELYILYAVAGICFADWCRLLLNRKELNQKKRR